MLRALNTKAQSLNTRKRLKIFLKKHQRTEFTGDTAMKARRSLKEARDGRAIETTED